MDKKELQEKLEKMQSCCGYWNKNSVNRISYSEKIGKIIAQEHILEDKSIVEIANNFGVSYLTILKYLHKYLDSD